MAKSHTTSKSDQALNNVLRQIYSINSAKVRGIDLKFTEIQNTAPIQYKESKKDSNLTAVMAKGYKKTKKLSPKQQEKNLIQLSASTGVPIEVLRINPNLRIKA